MHHRAAAGRQRAILDAHAVGAVQILDLDARAQAQERVASRHRRVLDANVAARAAPQRELAALGQWVGLEAAVGRDHEAQPGAGRAAAAEIDGAALEGIELVDVAGHAHLS